MNADGRRTRMNADPSFVFNPRLSAAIDSDDFFNTRTSARATFPNVSTYASYR